MGGVTTEGRPGSVTRRSPLVLVAVMLACALPACVVSEPETPARGIVVSGPPPAPMGEERSAPPSAQAIWVGGYWHWTGMQYAWIPGHWETPRPGATWSAPVYSVRDGRYIYENGGWRPAGRNALR